MRYADSGRRSSSVGPDESAHVVGDIGKADFNPRAGQRACALDQHNCRTSRVYRRYYYYRPYYRHRRRVYRRHARRVYRRYRRYYY